MDLLRKFIDKLDAEKKLKIAVVGDSMLDEYYNIEANRVSPEFPIPVMLSNTSSPDHIYPGGAANVAYLLGKFNVDPYLVSILDREAVRKLQRCGIDTSCCVSRHPPIRIGSAFDDVGWIPRKKRLYKGDFPLCRWDIEKPQMGFSNEELFARQVELLRLVETLNPDIVILSDYGKGTFANVSGRTSFFNGNVSKEMWIWNDAILGLKDKRPWTTIVDPKNDDLLEWSGCTVFKPNNHEAKILTGCDDHVDQVAAMKHILKCEYAVVTHGGEKIVGIDEGGSWTLDGRHKGEARYPIGAGDCFISTLAMAYPFFNPLEAAEIAYEMGAIYVSTEDRSIGPLSINQSKIKTPEELIDITGNVGFANGCFDYGLTRGHIELFKFAKENCDKLIVALNDDESVNRLKGDPRPIETLSNRMDVVAALECVDYVTSFSEDTPLNVIKTIQPKRIFKGGDYEAKDVVGNELAEVFICPLYDCLSTTDKLKVQS